MKRIIIFCMSLFATFAIFAQNSGLGFNYQAVVRNNDGLLLTNSNVTLRVSLYPGQTAASPTWVETHSVQTDWSGTFGITVGHGTRATTSLVTNFSDINFAAVYFWMKIEILEGSSYREVSYAQLPSAPYCEVAQNASAVPVGCIMPFAGPATSVPAGWMLCDGTAISRTTYANLYNVIGVAWGTGDGSTTFNLPDLRGMFLRGLAGTDSIGDPDANARLANANGGNSGNNVGSYQGDAIRNITGAFDGNYICNWGGVTQGAFGVRNSNFHHPYGGSPNGQTFDFDASRVVPVGSDNRPKNVAVNYIIKY